MHTLSKNCIKRCIASLMIVVVLGGVYFPSTALAALDEEYKKEEDVPVLDSSNQEQSELNLGSDVTLKEVDLSYYYKKDSKNGSHTETNSKKLLKFYMTDTAQEYFGWANVHNNSISGDGLKDIIGVEPSKIGNLRELGTDNDINFTKNILSKIDESLGSGIDDRASLMEALVNMTNSQGASVADVSTLNQRMAAFLYMRLNPKEFHKNNTFTWESLETVDDGNYSAMLSSTLELGHNENLDTLLQDIDLKEDDSNLENQDVIDNGKVMLDEYAYSVKQIGIFGVDVAPMSNSGQSGYNDTDSMIYSPLNTVYVLNEMAAYICFAEYINWYKEDMVDMYNTQGWELDEEAKSVLTYLKVFNDTFSPYIPFIKRVYEQKNPDAGDMSIKEMVERAGANDMSLADAIKVDVGSYAPHEDTTTPVSQFYTVNSDIGIVGYQRDQILVDVEVNKTYDQVENDYIEKQETNDDAYGGSDDYYDVSNTFLSQQVKRAEELQKLLKEYEKYTVAPETEQPSDALTRKNNAASASIDFCLEFVKADYDVIRVVLYEHYGPTWADSIKSHLEVLDTEKERKDAEKLRGELKSDRLSDKEKEKLDKLTNHTLAVAELFTDDVKREINNIVGGNDTSAFKEYLEEATDDTKEMLEKLVSKKKDYGIDEDGMATSPNSVTINKFIIEGMGYSASYVPMKTNVYNADTILMYKGVGGDTSEFYDFYLKYGFMRKALLIDKSASSAMDYYNANATTTGDTKVCTLRDLLYSGDKDVTLYVDPNFYNADIAEKQGNEILKSTYERQTGILEGLEQFSPIWKNSDSLTHKVLSWLNNVAEGFVRSLVLGMVVPGEDDATVDFDQLKKEFRKAMMSRYKFDIATFDTAKEMDDYVADLSTGQEYSSAASELNDTILKTGDAFMYDMTTQSYLSSVKDSEYTNLSGKEGDFTIDKSDDGIYTDDNVDSIVLTSASINEFLSGTTVYSTSEVEESDDSITTTTNTYTADSGYSPLMSLAYVSCIYRSLADFTVANAVESNNPVFMASDDLCGVSEANQWYRNTLLNYALLKNLRANAQVDVSIVVDLDCPVYMDIFGNILTESGIVVIPAASNATLHLASFRNYNYAAGLYSVYGKEYSIPTDIEGAQSVLYPYFVPDNNAGVYVVNAVTMSAGGAKVRFDKLDTYDDTTRRALQDAYKASIATGKASKLNWMAMVKIINEVMRGAPIEAIDKEKESLYVDSTVNSIVAAAKFEAMLNSLAGEMSNTLLCIPDFSRTDNLEYWVAFLIKIMMVVLAAVVIISVYRDGVSGQLGFRTFIKSLTAIALTISCIVVVPSVFQLTYYSANKALLENESLRILMVNEEKRQGGVEIGVTEINTVESTGEFALQLDWVTVPWYEELENILYDSTLDNLQQVKLEAYRNTATYSNPDVTMYNDGVYITTDDLFDSVFIDYTFNNEGSTRGLYLNANNPTQTASFYSPYYVFLRALVANVNEYNRWLNTAGDSYANYEEASKAESGNNVVLGSYNYTTKYMSGNRLKTVGLCEAYFTSDNFMTYDEDLLRIYQIYKANPTPALAETDGNYYDLGPAAKALTTRETSMNRAEVFGDTDRTQFRNSYWFDKDLISTDMEYYTNVKAGKIKGQTKAEIQQNYIAKNLNKLYDKVEAMDNYARDFIANNKDLLGKVTDETFLKVMALGLAIKYNQLFGVPSANSIEIYNMDSEDLLRLCIVPSDEAVMSTAMSYPRFVYTFGGEAGVYLAAVLSAIMWVGSFIKPLCTIIVFISVFMSIFVFRVVLRRPSANLWGYLVTTLLLCATNLLHALILKVGVSLPDFGLSTVGCLAFLLFGQVSYLLVLSYVTGVSLRDWSNLGAGEYEKEANAIRNRLITNTDADKLNGNIKHHDDNWEYYNDLVKQHRSRNRV